METLQFSVSERKLYDSIYMDVRKKFERLNEKGLVNKNYTSILAMLMRYDLPFPHLLAQIMTQTMCSWKPRLRRAVLHPHLVMTQEELEELEDSLDSTDKTVKLEDLVKYESDGATVSKTNAAFVEETLKSLSTKFKNQCDEGEGGDECPLCLDVMETPVLIPPCMHKWCVNGPVTQIRVTDCGWAYSCKDCVVNFLETCQEQGKNGVCPVCSSGPVKEGDLLEVVLKESDAGEEGGTSKVVIRKNDFVSSTKIDALLRNLREPSDTLPGSYSDRLVVSQDESETKTPTSEWWCSPSLRPSLT